MRARIISITASSIILILGCVVMLGWYLRIPALVQVYPGFVGMAFNTGLLFSVTGFAILFANYHIVNPQSYLLRVTGLFILIFASVSLSEDIFHYSLHINFSNAQPWLQDPDPRPSHMAPNTSIAFILAGLFILLLTFRQARFVNIILAALISLIFMIAVVGILIYSLRLDYIFTWYPFARMAIHTAVGLILISLGLWCLVIQYPDFDAMLNDKEEKRILITFGTVLAILTLITGFGSIAIITNLGFGLIQSSLKASMLNKIEIIKNEISSMEGSFQILLKNIYFQNLIRDSLIADSTALRNALELIFIDNNMAVRLVTPQGKIIYEKNKFIENPELSAPIKADFNSTLLWHNGFWLRMKIPIYSDKKIIAELIGESPLYNTNRVYTDLTSLGSTGESIICSYVNSNEARCFPSRLSKHAFTEKFDDIEKQTLPTYYAMHNITGSGNLIDYRGHRVVAAYAPIYKSNLGIALKMDAEEIYRPISKLMVFMFPAAFIIIFVGLSLLRWQVVPLIQQVIQSKREVQKSKIDLERSEQRYEIAVSSSNTGLWDWDLTTNFFYTSDLFKKMLGYTHDEFPNTLDSFLNRIHPEDKSRVKDLFTKINIDNKSFNIEYRLQTKSGVFEWFQTIGRILLDGNNKPIRMAGSLLNINERKNIEKMKNEFISIVSHELRTPLTSINGALSLILSGSMGELTAKSHQLLKIANSNCVRLINLINNILDVEKIESGTTRIELKPISISTIIKDAIDANQPYAEKFHVFLELVDDVPDKIQVDADYDRLMQVLNNLLSNAVKFSPANETVKISIKCVDNNVRVAITDKGTGISQDFKKNIFKRFSQADASPTRKKSGTGLGLNISKSLIEAMNGKLDFYNTKDAGATFYFDLPRSKNSSV